MNVPNRRECATQADGGKLQALQVALCGLIAGVLLGCSFPPIDATYLAWIALAPLGVVLTQKSLTRQCWAGVYLGGLVYHLVALRWISELEPDSSLLSIWLVLAQLGAIIFCLSMLLARRVVVRFNLPGCLGIPVFWLGFEYIRMVVAWTIDPAAVSWLRLGGTQLEWTLLAQVAGIGGEVTLSALLALVNGWIYQFARFAISWKSRTPERLPKAALVAPLALIASLAYGWWCLSTFSPSVGPTVALLGRQEWLQNRERAWENGVVPELMVWPELSDHHKYVTDGSVDTTKFLPVDVELLSQTLAEDYSSWFRKRLAQAADSAGAAILLGCERVDLSDDLPRRYNSLVYADAERGFVGYCDKRLLAPLYENEVPVANWLGITSDELYCPGPTSTMFTLRTQSGEKKFACIVCNDISSPHCMKPIGAEGVADFYVHCGSEATDRTGVVSKTLLRMARLRAIESRRPIVRNCHQGACGVIDSVGRFTPCEKSQGRFVPVRVPLSPGRDLTADWVSPLFASGLSVLLLTCVLPISRIDYRKTGVTVETLVSVDRSSSTKRHPKSRPSGFSLLELLAVVAILGTIAAIILPRVTVTGDTAKEKADAQNRAIINAAVERFYLSEGEWPELDLSDIGANPEYFPQGIPTNPVTGADYELDPTTYRVKVGSGGGK